MLPTSPAGRTANTDSRRHLPAVSLDRVLRVGRLMVMGIALVSMTSAAKADEPTQTELANWHHWRGPYVNGSAAPSAKPPLEWSESENLRWKTPIAGKGSSTPVITGDNIFVLSSVDTGKPGKSDVPDDPSHDVRTEPPKTIHQFIIHCLEKETGKPRWQKVVKEAVPHEGHHDTHSYAGGSPATDGKHVWFSFGSQGTYCFDLDGNEIWSRDLGILRTRLGWGEAVTPVLDGNRLFLNWDQETNSKLICLDAKTGKTLYEVPRDEKTTWNTPLVTHAAGRSQVIVNGANRIRSYDTQNGKLLWECGGMTTNPIPSPVADDKFAYVMSGFKGSGGVAVPLDATGDVTGTNKVLWAINRGTPYVPSPVLTEGRLVYTQQNNALLTILDAKTGSPLVDRERLPKARSYYASPIAADGRIYFVDRNGTATVIANSPSFEVLATNTLNDTFDASPIALGNRLYLRGEKHLYCLENLD